MSEVQRQSPLSTRRMINVGQENSRTDKELEKELCKIEKERLARLRELNQETKQFRVSSARARSAGQRDLSPASSPTRTIDCSFRPGSSRLSPRGQEGQNPPTPQNQSRPDLSRSVSQGQDSLSPCEFPPIRGKANTVSTSPSRGSPLSNSLSKLSRSPTPKQGYFKAISIDNGDISPRNHSPCSSPESQRLLPRRGTSEEKRSGVSTVTTTVTVIYHPEETTSSRKMSIFSAAENAIRRLSTSSCESAENANDMNTDTSLPDSGENEVRPCPRPALSSCSVIPPIPQIVISSEPLTSAPKTKSLNSDTRKPKAGEEEDLSPVGNVKNDSLAVPIKRSRSSSVPSLPPETTYLRSIAKKQSTFTTADTDSEPETIRYRQRSCSICVPYFSHLKDSPRRDSLLKKYTARRGSYRRTSVTIDHVIADLAKGIYHAELNPHPREKPISPEEWERLKKCRYLRMPKREEDKENKLDLDDIFSHSH